MSGALVVRADQTAWDAAQTAALAQIGVAEAPDGDQAMFLHQCQRTGLDPFARQIYMIGRWDNRTKSKKWTIQVGIDGLRLIAQRTGMFTGRLGPWWCGPDGEWRDVWLDSDPPAAARVGVQRTGLDQPVYAVAIWREYGQETATWNRMPAHMLAKVAEALALRVAFPQDMGGLYTDDELGTAPEVVPASQPAPAAAVMSTKAQWDLIADAVGVLTGHGWAPADSKHRTFMVAELAGADKIPDIAALTSAQAEQALTRLREMVDKAENAQPPMDAAVVDAELVDDAEPADE